MNTNSNSKIIHSIITHLSSLLDIPASEVSLTQSFFSYGLDSSGALTLVGLLENDLDIVLDPSVLWDKSNVADLADYLAQY